ncbi:MAG: flagellar biosynthetic protein FliO [Selenomonadaceae bacterium]|nr:flagellar biosynthetic protein FliO [Selenomonadaceae bacterium]MBR2733447.1 flagellar biosynthetic protein FliO [Selenomonadaceae bacterium]
MFDKIKFFIPVAPVLFCLMYFDGSVAEAARGYLDGYEEVNPQPTGISWWSTLAYLFSLLAVFAVVLIMAYFAARFIGGRYNAARISASGGRVLENLPLGPNRSVCTVEMAGRVFLLGVTDHNINLLGEITDKDLIEHLHAQTINSGDMFSQEFGTLSDLVRKIPLFKKRN